MPASDGLELLPWDGTVGVIVLGAMSATIAIALLLVVCSRRLWNALGPPEAPAVPETREATVVRVVSVVSTGCGIVVDALVDRGDALGPPGSPIALVLEPEVLDAPTQACLRRWAEDDALVDVELIPGVGFVPPVIDLRHGARSLRLPLLFVQ